MHRWLGADWMHRPAIIQTTPTLHPLDRTPGLSVGRLPGCSEREIDPAVTVYVIGRYANVVLFRLILNDYPLLPVRILEPDDGRLGNGNNVQLLIPIYVG
jgi:hypothetical protein